MTNVTLSNSVYDKLKTFTLLWIPAISSLYFGLSQILGLPAAEKVVGTLALFATFLGTVLRLSSSNYQESTDGSIIKEYDPESDRLILAIEMNEEAEIIGTKNRIVLDVVDRNEDFWSREG